MQTIKDIDWNRLKQILNFYIEKRVCNGTNKRIYIGGMGEPLLYPNLFDLTKYIAKKNNKILIKTVTNGILLDRHIDDILTSSLNSIVISLNSFSKESHAFLSGNIFYDRIKASVVSLLTKKKELKLKFPKIGLQFRRTSVNQQEEKDFIVFWSSHMTGTDYFQMRELENQGGEIDISSLKQKNASNYCDRWPCGYLWNTLALDVDFNLYPCCKGFFLREKNDALKIDSLADGDLAEIFNSKKFEIFRNAHLNDTYNENQLHSCLNCDSYKFFFKNNWVEN